MAGRIVLDGEPLASGGSMRFRRIAAASAS